LKVSEGLAESLLQILVTKLSHDVFRQAPGLMRAIREMKALRDYSEFGGAPLLGVNGNLIICHGRSGAKAIQSAIQMAVAYVDNQVSPKISDILKSN